MSRATSISALAACAAIGACVPATANGFRTHARYSGIGGCLKQVVGPGPTAGSERLYSSHIYGGDVLDIVAVDPDTGKFDVFSSPIPGEVGAWAMVLGPDKQVYVGTLPTAHILKVDWQQKKLVDMGRPSETEQYIWQLAVGADNKLYGCTYPGAKLVRFDPATGKGEDLGRMDPNEQYARCVAADKRGFVYVGIGTEKRHLVAYEIATGEHRDILTPEMAGPGSCPVSRGEDGNAYGAAGPNLRLDGWKATPITPAEVSPEPPLRLADGRIVAFSGRKVTTTDPKTNAATTHDVAYQGRSQSLFRIGLGPDGRLYGSTAMPIHFFWADPDSDRWEELGELGGGEFYSLLAHQGMLLGAAYSGQAPLMVYRPDKPYAPGASRDSNPWLIHYEGENAGWRPMAMVGAPDGKAYVGAVSGYGLLGGPLCVFDPATGKVEQYLHLVKDQSVVSLALLPGGMLAGGTTVGGGGGSHPTQTEAKLFVWDPQRREKVFETVPVPGQGSISALAVTRDGLLYGFAGPTLFVFDPKTQKVVKTAPHGLGDVIYNAAGVGPGGALYGLASGGIFRIDEPKREVKLLARYPGGIQGGFAIRGQRIYFTSGPQVVSYELPR